VPLARGKCLGQWYIEGHVLMLTNVHFGNHSVAYDTCEGPSVKVMNGHVE
jgi:hypothetical protein